MVCMPPRPKPPVGIEVMVGRVAAVVANPCLLLLVVWGFVD